MAQTDALAAIGINDPIIDPFSGESLKLKSGQPEIIIYSVGHDGVDQNGTSVSPRGFTTNEFIGRAYLAPNEDQSKPKSGDFLFEFKY